MLRLTVDPSAPVADALALAARAIRAGGVLAVPTDTLYGLAVNPFDPAAVEKIYALKGRSAAQALPLIAADRAQVEARLGPLNDRASRLADRFWPGPLTLLLPASPALAAQVTAGTGRVGVRVPAHPVARALCRVSGTLLTATSANPSGLPASSDPDLVADSLQGIDVLVDAGTTPGGPPSTIVDVTGDRPVLVRSGAIPWEDIRACLERA